MPTRHGSRNRKTLLSESSRDKHISARSGVSIRAELSGLWNRNNRSSRPRGVRLSDWHGKELPHASASACRMVCKSQLSSIERHCICASQISISRLIFRLTELDYDPTEPLCSDRQFRALRTLPTPTLGFLLLDHSTNFPFSRSIGGKFSTEAW